MNIKNKKRCTYAIIVFYNLCTGIGYGIIFPTIWNYVHIKLGGDTTMLGLIVSSYSISSFFINPLIGWWSDKIQKSRLILFMSVVSELIGSFMYFVGKNNSILVVSRIVAGLGSGGAAAVISDICRTTAEEERTPVLSVIIASRQLGLLLGPALNLGLSKLEFENLTFPIDKYTSPGLFMAILWFLLLIGILFFYHNLTELCDQENLEQLFQGYKRQESCPPETEPSDLEASIENPLTISYPACSSNFNLVRTSSLSTSVPNLQPEVLENYESNIKLQKEEIKTILCKRLCAVSDDHSLYSHWQPNHVKPGSECGSSTTDNMIETAEHFIQSASESFHGQNVESLEQNQRKRTYSERQRVSDISMSSSADERMSLLKRVDRGFFRDEIVVLLGLSFFSCFSQTVLETVVTPLAQKLYNFDEVGNSLIYLLSGLEVILIYTCLQRISRYVSDRVLLVFGILTLCITMGLPLFFVPNAVEGDKSTLWLFIVTVIFDQLGIAIIVVCSASLLSKIISQESQAFAQGLRRSMISLGCIIGPLWGGSFLTHLVSLFAVPLGVCILISVLFVCSYKRMK